MYVYDYKITVAPRKTYSDLSVPTGYTAYVYGKANKAEAAEEFWGQGMRIARKNGVQRGKNQFADNMTITRIAKRRVRV